MKNTNEDFSVPMYLVEEIVEYVEETAKGRCRCGKWNNIVALIGLAKVNRKIDTRTS